MATKRPREEHTPFETPLPWVLNYAAENFPGVCMLDSTEYLSRPWEEWSFLAPPMTAAHLWIAKAVSELQKGNKSVLLVPATFNSKYFRELVMKYAAEIRILLCPYRPDNKKNKTVHQMCFIVFAPRFAGDENVPAVEEPVITAVDPSGWQEQYYKRARNRETFGVY